MTNGQSIRYEMLLRVGKFGENHRDLFPPASVGGQAFTDIAAAVSQLSDRAVSKMSSAREGVSSKASARIALRRRLFAIARSARVIGRTHPGFETAFRVPESQTDQGLLTTGRMFLAEAEKVKDRFAEYGMPADFVARLSQQVEDFAQALQTLESGRDGHTAATAGIDAALASGLEAVRKLDVIVANLFETDPVTLAVWERDRRIDYARRVRRAVSVWPRDEGVDAPPTAKPTEPTPTNAVVTPTGASS